MNTLVIQPIAHHLRDDLQHKIDSKTKPVGALGRLEALALQIGLIQGTLTPALCHPHLLVFAGDHGIAQAGVSAYPPEVTWQMVGNFLRGGAAINAFCQPRSIRLWVVDAGVNYDFPASWDVPVAPNSPRLVRAKLGYGTNNCLEGPAMTLGQAQDALDWGATVVDQVFEAGSNVVGFGEMGIGNTSAASLLTHVLTGQSLEACTGRGTGLDDNGWRRKVTLLGQAVATNGCPTSPLAALATYGGFEIAQMVGAMGQAAARSMLLLVDGFIATAALAVAEALYPGVRDYAVSCHQSAEPGHQALLQLLDIQPLLQLHLRLGEGTGVALAYPLVQAAVDFLTHMASFDDAGVATQSIETNHTADLR